MLNLRDIIATAATADGRTQAEIAKAARIHAPKLSTYLSGQKELRGDSLCRLLDVLRITVTPPPPPPHPGAVAVGGERRRPARVASPSPIG